MFEKFKEKIRKNGGKISRIALIVICAGLIITFMPKAKSIQYEFNEGEPWKHEQLLAEFDFDIYKSKADIEAEEDSIYTNSVPTFKQLSTSIARNIDFFHAMKEGTNEGELLELYNNSFIIADSDTAFLHKGRTQQAIIVYLDNSKNSGKPQEVTFITLSELGEMFPTYDTNEKSSIIRHPNFICDTIATQADLARELGKIELIAGNIKEGERIIGHGEKVDRSKARAINSYLTEKNKRVKAQSEDNWLYIMLGQSVFIVICLLLLLAYITQYKKDVLNNTNKFIFTILTATIFPVIVGIMTEHGEFNVFILPFAIVPIMLCLFIDHNTAFVTYTISLAMCSVMIATPYEFLLLQMMAGCSAILSLKDLSSRSQMFKCVTITFLTYSAIYLCYEMITWGSLENLNSMMYA